MGASLEAIVSGESCGVWIGSRCDLQVQVVKSPTSTSIRRPRRGQRRSANQTSPFHVTLTKEAIPLNHAPSISITIAISSLQTPEGSFDMFSVEKYSAFVNRVLGVQSWAVLAAKSRKKM